jgi:hypothetical protein
MKPDPQQQRSAAVEALLGMIDRFLRQRQDQQSPAPMETLR